MIQVEGSIVINKPPAEVYAYVSSGGENTLKWQGGVEAVENEGPSATVGSRYTETRRFLGQEMKTTLEITEVVANAKLTSKVVKGPVPYLVSVTFEGEGGGTKMTIRLEGEPTGFFKMAEGMVAGQLEKSLNEDLQRLKKILKG